MSGGYSALGDPVSSSHEDWQWVTEIVQSKTTGKEEATVIFDSTIPSL